MTRSRGMRAREEYVLLAVSAGAAAVAVVSAIQAVPSKPVIWAATSVALALSLTTSFVFWFAGAVRRTVSETMRDEEEAVRRVLSAVPDGLLLVDSGRVISVNRRLCELLGYDRDELVGAVAPFPFWPPEHRHEIERWHTQLGEPRELVAHLMFSHRGGDRVPVLVAAGAVAPGTDDQRYVLTVRDVSPSYRRERRLSELSSRDPETALLNERGFEERIRDAVRRAIADGTNASVVVAELGGDAGGWNGCLSTPEALLVVERLQALLRDGDELARTRDDEIAWILPDTNADGAIEAVRRARRAISDTGTTLTAGICDFAAAGDAPSLYALADRALAEARRRGRGTTASYPHVRAEIDALDRGSSS